MANGLKDVGKSTPVVEVIRRVLESKGGPVTVEELTVHVMDSWGRDFPGSPYEDVGLVYKLATRILGCTASFDEVGGEIPVVEGATAEEEPTPLHARMHFEDLNRVAEELRHVKLQLPVVTVATLPVAEEKPATGRKRK